MTKLFIGSLLTTVTGFYSALPAASPEFHRGESIVQLCTYTMTDVPPASFYRLVIEREGETYYGHFIILSEKRGARDQPWVPVVHWEVGHIPKGEFKALREKILALNPQSMRPPHLPMPDRFGAAESWVKLNLIPGREISLYFPSSPASQEGVPLEKLPTEAKSLLELLWQIRGLVQVPAIMQIDPPFFTGSCFEPKIQQYANGLVHKLRAANRKMND